MSSCLYDWRKDRGRLHPYAGFLFLGLGLFLLAKFLNEFRADVRRDIRNFQPVWQSSPILALFLAIIVLCAYIFGSCLIGLMIYIPCRNFFFPRVVEGKFEAITTIFNSKGKSQLLIKMEDTSFRVPDLVDLKLIIGGSGLEGQKLRFTLGAFNRVLKIDKLLLGAHLFFEI
jgi:hypothetical protein